MRRTRGSWITERVRGRASLKFPSSDSCAHSLYSSPRLSAHGFASLVSRCPPSPHQSGLSHHWPHTSPRRVHQCYTSYILALKCCVLVTPQDCSDSGLTSPMPLSPTTGPSLLSYSNITPFREKPETRLFHVPRFWPSVVFLHVSHLVWHGAQQVWNQRKLSGRESAASSSPGSPAGRRSQEPVRCSSGCIKSKYGCGGGEVDNGLGAGEGGQAWRKQSFPD